MQFRIRQNFDAPIDAVMRVFTDPGFYPYLHGLTKIGAPQVLDRREDGEQVLMWIRYQFTGDLPAAARRVIDPAKLTWVEAARYDYTARTAWTQLIPDHYGDKMTASAVVTFEADPGPHGRSTRTLDGDLKVSVPLVGGKVEHAIVSGLREHMAEEQKVAAWWLGQKAAGLDPQPPAAAQPDAPPPEAPPPVTW